MGLWEQAAAKAAARDIARPTSLEDGARQQYILLQEFVQAMKRLGVAPSSVELRGWHSQRPGDSRNIASGELVVGWIFHSWRGQSTRTDFLTPEDTTYFFVVTEEISVFNTEDQKVASGLMRKRWTFLPTILPLPKISSEELSQRLSNTIAARMRERRI